MLRRRLLLGVLAWIGVVALVSAVTWAAINAAGQELLSQSDALPTVREPATAPGPSIGTRLPTPTSDPATGSPGAGSPSAAEPSRTATSGPTSTVPEPSPVPSSPPAGGEDGDVELRTWQGEPGAMTVRCEGGQASLQSATPNDGYRVEVKERGPEEVEVRFEAEEHEVRVEAFCSDGVPEFSTDS